jgi:hypothetical protein
MAIPGLKDEKHGLKIGYHATNICGSCRQSALRFMRDQALVQTPVASHSSSVSASPLTPVTPAPTPRQSPLPTDAQISPETTRVSRLDENAFVALTVPVKGLLDPAVLARTPHRGRLETTPAKTPRAPIHAHVGTRSSRTTPDAPPVSGAILVGLRRLLQLTHGVRCNELQCPGRLWVYEVQRTAGGCGVLYRSCDTCMWQQGWFSGQRIKSLHSGHCGVGSLEELRAVHAFFVSGVSTYADYCRTMNAMSLLPISADQFRKYCLWLRVFVLAVLALSMKRGRDVITSRESAAVGSATRIVASSDCFWPERAKKNHCGSSPHGTVPIIDFFNGYILAVRILSNHFLHGEVPSRKKQRVDAASALMLLPSDPAAIEDAASDADAHEEGDEDDEAEDDEDDEEDDEDEVDADEDAVEDAADARAPNVDSDSEDDPAVLSASDDQDYADSDESSANYPPPPPPPHPHVPPPSDGFISTPPPPSPSQDVAPSMVAGMSFTPCLSVRSSSSASASSVPCLVSSSSPHPEATHPFKVDFQRMRDEWKKEREHQRKLPAQSFEKRGYRLALTDLKELFTRVEVHPLVHSRCTMPSTRVVAVRCRPSSRTATPMHSGHCMMCFQPALFQSELYAGSTM